MKKQYNLYEIQAVKNMVSEDTVSFLEETFKKLEHENLAGVVNEIEYFVETECSFYNSKSSTKFDINKLVDELNKNIINKCRNQLELHGLSD